MPQDLRIDPGVCSWSFRGNFAQQQHSEFWDEIALPLILAPPLTMSIMVTQLLKACPLSVKQGEE